MPWLPVAGASMLAYAAISLGCNVGQFASEITPKLSTFAKQQQLITEQTRMGTAFAETDDTLAYIGAVLFPTVAFQHNHHRWPCCTQ